MKPTPVDMRPPKAPRYQHRSALLRNEVSVPATVIDAEKKAILVALTLGGYQKQRYMRHPGLGISKAFTKDRTGQVRIDSQETSFGDTKKHSTGNKAFIGRHCGCAAGDDTPRYHDSGDPPRRGEVFHGDVGWEFKKDIWTECSVQSLEAGRRSAHMKKIATTKRYRSPCRSRVSTSE